MKEFDAVVFDMDGVIFDSERATMECWEELSQKYGFGDITDAYLASVGTTAAKTKEIMQKAFGEDFDYDRYAKEASAMYHERYDGGRLPMKSGVVEILKALSNSGKKIALASSTRRQTVVAQLEAAGILEFFDEIVTGDMVEKSKPEPDIFLKACEKTGVMPKKAIAIEDSFNGIRAAFTGHLRPIMVPDLLAPDDEMREKSEVILESLSDVLKYLQL
jgi:HAD superfamily hydrolase (TIGR01509 family)